MPSLVTINYLDRYKSIRMFANVPLCPSSTAISSSTQAPESRGRLRSTVLHFVHLQNDCVLLEANKSICEKQNPSLAKPVTFPLDL